MDPVNVTVTGALTVPVKADALSLVMEIDPSMHRDITDEAIRTCVCDKLGGFQGVQLTRAPSAKPSSARVTPGEAVTAVVDFDALAHSIHQLISAYDQLADAADTMDAPLRTLEGPGASPEASAAALAKLRQAVTHMRQLGPAGPPAAAGDAANTGQAAGDTSVPATVGAADRGSSGGSDDDADDASSFDAAAAGYAPLLDGDDDDDGEDGEPADEGGADYGGAESDAANDGARR